MRSRIFAAGIVSCALFVSGCGGILVRPAADNVRTVAFISVFMNRDFYDLRSPRASVALEGVIPLAHAVIKGAEIPEEIEDRHTEAYEQLIDHGIAAYSEKLAGIGNWRWVPPAAVTSNSAYREFAASLSGKDPAPKAVRAVKTLRRAEWYTARDMVRIPLDRVVRAGGKTVTAGNAKDDLRPALARLCKDLRVDAVAILELDMAYRKPITGVDVIGGLYAIPNVGSALVIVNKDGEITVNSGLITKGQGRRYDGKGLRMLAMNHVNLDDNSIDSYCLAIDRSAESIKKRLAAAFGKTK